MSQALILPSKSSPRSATYCVNIHPRAPLKIFSILLPFSAFLSSFMTSISLRAKSRILSTRSKRNWQTKDVNTPPFQRNLCSDLRFGLPLTSLPSWYQAHNPCVFRNPRSTEMIVVISNFFCFAMYIFSYALHTLALLLRILTAYVSVHIDYTANFCQHYIVDHKPLRAKEHFQSCEIQKQLHMLYAFPRACTASSLAESIRNSSFYWKTWLSDYPYQGDSL